MQMSLCRPPVIAGNERLLFTPTPGVVAAAIPVCQADAEDISNSAFNTVRLPRLEKQTATFAGQCPSTSE